MPDYVFDADLGTVTMKATKFVIQVGENSIVLDNNGITIKGMNLDLEATVQAQVKAVMLKEQVSGVKEASAALLKQG